MKKSNKIIPKTHLPKYGVGILTPEEESGSNTQSMYNAGRKKNIYAKGDNPNTNASTGQYVAAAGALTQGGANMYQTYNDPNATNRDKADSFDNTARATTSAINPVIGAAIGVGDMIGKPIRNSLEKTDPVTGKVKNRQAVKIGAAVGMFADPGKWIGHIANGGLKDISGNKYVDNIETNAKAQIDANAAQEAQYAEQQNAYNQQQSNYNMMFQDYQNRNNQQSNNNLGTVQYAFGGMKFGMGGANAEIESEENVVAPNGGFLQANGPTHEQGGVPVALPGNSMVFSDRLKLGKKTFAELNKINNTNKEDKILESNKFGNTSKRTAELMKFAKNKNSEELFNAQEALKQAKVETYAKKMGITLPQAQEAPEEGIQYAMGGLKQYGPGGPVDNTKFTPGQRQQAYNDSMTLYKSGFNKAVPNWQKEPGYNDAILNLYKLNGTTPQSTDKSHLTYDPNYLKAHSVPYAKPVYDPSIETKKTKPVSYPMINMPMKGLENSSLNFNPQLQQVPANSKPGSSKIEMAPNFSIKKRYDSKGNLVDKEYFDTMNPERQIEVAEFRGGGRMLPKYAYGNVTNDLTPEQQFLKSKFMGAEQNQRNLAFNQMTGNTTPGYNTKSTTEDVEEELQLANDVIDKQHGWNRNDPSTKPKSKNPNSRNFDWQEVGSNVAMGLANNAGNIYNLSRYNKPEVEKYDRMKATFLDPSASLRDATEQTRRAEYNVRGASGGNAGTYLANRVGLNAQNIMTKDRIQKEYQNANAGIANSTAQYNNELSRQEVIANAQNRARNRSGKGEAIGSMGSNIANQMMDNKKGNMDQETLQLMMKYYDTPEFQKMMKDSKFNKKQTKLKE